MRELFNKLEELKNVDYSKNQENLDLFENYISEFFNKYPKMDLSKLIKISFEELVTYLFLIKNSDDILNTLQVIKEELNEFKNTNENILSFLLSYCNEEWFTNEVDKLLNSNNALMNIIGKNTPQGIVANYIKKYGISASLKRILRNIEPESWNETLDFYKTILEGKKLIKGVPEEFVKINGRKIIIECVFFEEVYEFSDEQYRYLEKLYLESHKKLDAEIKNIKRLNKKIDRLIANLNVDSEIKNIDEIISICPEEFKNEVLDYVIEHNKKYYISLVEKYETLKKNSIENIALLFTRYKYNIDDLTEENKILIKKIGYDNIEKILQILNKYNINVDINKIVLLDIKKLETIEELIISGVLTNIFIQENINIIYSNNEILTLILKNITLLSENNINIKNYNNSLSVLLNENLENSLFILKEYNLSITRETSCILFLNDLDLIDKIDLIITLGIYDNISNLDILNSNVLVLLKEKELKTLNIDCEKIDLSKIEVSSFNNSNEFVPVYYLNVLNSEYKNEISLPEFLEQYKINDFVLSINGVLVSINRLLRNLSKFDNIDEEKVLYSIIYNSYYSLEEIENLSETLTKKDVYSLVRSI